ncbi:MAG TPA: hypothetical protein VGC81_03100 [Candidatus Methylomirabilis sp.]
MRPTDVSIAGTIAPGLCRRTADRMELSQQVCDAGQEVASATGPTLAAILNGVLERFLGWPFKATPGYATDRDGNSTATFASVIHTPSASAATTVPNAIPADTVAAVIDASESMDRLEEFRVTYRRVAQAKTLRKSPAPELESIPNTTVTLGIIFALRSALPLEEFAEELDRLNLQTPSQQWPDMVVVARTGTINYAVQFPGEQVSGDFLPPAEGAPAAYTPPIYVHIVMTPAGVYTFNKMLSFLIGHLAIFSPGSDLPNFAHILPGVPKHAVTVSGYQYDLSGHLLPVPRHLYNDRHVPRLPIRIEDQEGNLLSTIRFLPWQDGGAILLKGLLPLAPFLLLLGEVALQPRSGIVKRPDAQISYVLPITQTHFEQMLARIHQQTNMVVRSDPTKFVFRKFADEGSQSPFMARMLMGILRLRDAACPQPAARDRFDNSYEFVFSAVLNARAAAQQIIHMWEDHVRRVASGEVARVQGNTIHIDESIDKELRKGIEDFLNAAVRAIKQGTQSLARDLQADIGFLFQGGASFERGLAALQTTNPLLAEYLRQTRIVWSEDLMESRNAIEHKGWILPQVTYSDTGNGIRAGEPPVRGRPVSEFVRFMLDRLACFVEEITAHCLQRQMPGGITITEIALAHRVPEAPERFRVTLANGGMPTWSIVFHTSSFDET